MPLTLNDILHEDGKTVDAKKILSFLIAEDTSSSLVPGNSKQTVSTLREIGEFCASLGMASVVFHEETERFGKQGVLFVSLPCTSEIPEGGAVVSGHIDIVPFNKADWDSDLDPLTLTEKDGRIYGRGAVDMKGQLAGVLASMIEATFNGSVTEKPFTLVLTSGEEIGAITAGFAAQKLKEHIYQGKDPEAIVIMEPTDLADGNNEIVVSHRGNVGLSLKIDAGPVSSALLQEKYAIECNTSWWQNKISRRDDAQPPPEKSYASCEIVVSGKAGHSSKPINGIHAVAHLVAAHDIVETFAKESGIAIQCEAVYTHPGAGLNIIPAGATLKLVWPSANDSEAAATHAALKALLVPLHNAIAAEAHDKNINTAVGLHCSDPVIEVRTPDARKINSVHHAIAMTKYLSHSLQSRLDREFSDPRFDPPTPIINVGVIETTSTGEAELKVHCRLNPGIDPQEIIKNINTQSRYHNADIRQSNPTIQRGAVLSVLSLNPALRENDTHEVRQTLSQFKRVHNLVFGGETVIGRQPIATDAGNFSTVFDKSLVVVSGPGNINTQGAHGRNEYILPDQLEKAKRLTHELAVTFSKCTTPERVSAAQPQELQVIAAKAITVQFDQTNKTLQALSKGAAVGCEH